MTTRTTTILVLLMILGAIVAGALLWNQLPEQMASHWNVNDEVDDYMSKPWGVFMMPLVTLGMFVLFLVVPAIDPLKANIAKFREASDGSALHLHRLHASQGETQLFHRHPHAVDSEQ